MGGHRLFPPDQDADERGHTQIFFIVSVLVRGEFEYPQVVNTPLEWIQFDFQNREL